MMSPGLEMIAHDDRVEPDLFGDDREIEQFTRPELLGRSLITKCQQEVLLSGGESCP